jgi:uncharacterized protein (TIGR03435 family)
LNVHRSQFDATLANSPPPFNILATVPAGTPEQIPMMFQSFAGREVRTKVHRETRMMTVEGLAKFFNEGNPPILGLPVVDATALKGSYQVTLDYPANLTSGPPAPDEVSDQTGSIQESLHKMGLDVVGREIQSERFVIDHIEKSPHPN